MSFRPHWYIEQSKVHPSFWLAKPTGGRARVMATDDFGNMYEPCSETARITGSLTRAEHH